MISLIEEVPLGARVKAYRVGEKEFEHISDALGEARLHCGQAHPIDWVHPVVEAR